ncbi:MAG TPA: hypothetical protein VFX54_00600 [Candidatus Binatia bacterium]|nr:hypothetical protein [Candidatus Binatia bacterium]
MAFYEGTSGNPFAKLLTSVPAPTQTFKVAATKYMFSAQKHEMPIDTPSETSRRPRDTGFGKVLNSIQGLQQRLDDFSVEDVSRAHLQAQKLIRELSDLQAQLNALGKLKDAVIRATAEITALPDENFDLVDPDSFEKHPQLGAIVKAAKLIRMHRLMRAAQASADYVSLEISGIAGIDLPKNILTTTERLAIAPRADQVVAPPVDSAAASNIASAKIETDVASPSEDQSLSPSSLSTALQSKSSPKYEFAELTLDETQQRGFPETNDSLEAAMADKNLPIPPKDKKPSEKSRFNERLLSEVIESYGEFALVPISPIPPASTKITVPAPLTSTDLITLKAAPVESNLPQPKSAASSGSPVAASEKRHSSSKKPSSGAKSHGEIDRQLKNIIKDYGEYDLYSHQKSPNIKTVVIAAITVLALIAGGFYFFKTALSPAPAAIEDSLSSGRTTHEIETPSGTQSLNKTK